MSTPPQFLHAADQAVIVQFAEGFDPEANARVIGLDRNLSEDPITGIIETVPTYRSLMVHYDAAQMRAEALIEALRPRAEAASGEWPAARLWIVPAYYRGPEALDLDAVAKLHGITTEEVIRLHTEPEYRVAMIGFSPGLAYLGGLVDQLHTPRLSEPRQCTPAGGLAIGGVQANINTVESPSGWRFLGRTPLKIFDPARKNPFLMDPGDRVRFEVVNAREVARLDAISAKGGVAATCVEAS